MKEGITMMTLSHMLISKKVFSAISDCLDIKLNEKALTYGCIKPDLVPRLRAIPHNKEKSSDFINEIFEELRKQELPKSKEELKIFSINLGVILHYIADFFCFAHNCRYYDPQWPHFVYENNLALAFAFSDLDKICADAICSINGQHIKSKGWFREYLDSKHGEYLHSRQNMASDVKFSMEVCAVIAFAAVTCCMDKSGIIAA